MANRFWKFVKKTNEYREDRKDKNSENYINENPTEEELKDNKNGKVALILSIIACISLCICPIIILLAFKSNVIMGIFSILLFFIPARLQILAVKRIRKQLNINGKGKTKYLFIRYILPLISAIIAVTLFIVLLGVFFFSTK